MSPSLASRKRRQSTPSPSPQPPCKRMATSDDLMRAITEMNKNMAGINIKLVAFCTREDMHKLTREVKDGVERNASSIERLHELRKEDQARFEMRVESIIDRHVAGIKTSERGITLLSQREAEQEKDYLMARRSILFWPARGDDLKQAATEFLGNVLRIPSVLLDALKFEHLERTRQPRRSRIEDELLVRFVTATDRDAVQSYASNLADAGPNTGLRMQIPEHLKSLFKQFEKHGGSLKQKTRP